jgi:hypothetical protein
MVNIADLIPRGRPIAHVGDEQLNSIFIRCYSGRSQGFHWVVQGLRARPANSRNLTVLGVREHPNYYAPELRSRSAEALSDQSISGSASNGFAA